MKTHKQLSLRSILARNVRNNRNQRGWSQEKLAELAGLSRVYISNIENEKKSASIDAVEKIADSLKCSPGELLSHLKT